MQSSSLGNGGLSRSRDEQVERIRRLNDEFRRLGPGGDPEGRWVMTRGIQALGASMIVRAAEIVQVYDAFDQANDPHGEHDFGAFELGSERCFWKIDYYDRDQKGGSRNPADPAVTVRVMTTMLAEEY